MTATSGQHFPVTATSGQHLPVTATSGQHFQTTATSDQHFPVTATSDQNFQMTFTSGQHFPVTANDCYFSPVTPQHIPIATATIELSTVEQVLSICWLLINPLSVQQQQAVISTLFNMFLQSNTTLSRIPNFIEYSVKEMYHLTDCA